MPKRSNEFQKIIYLVQVNLAEALRYRIKDVRWVLDPSLFRCPLDGYDRNYASARIVDVLNWNCGRGRPLRSIQLQSFSL